MRPIDYRRTPAATWRLVAVMLLPVLLLIGLSAAAATP
jgi:hypothetical protein